jgi:hypothetical protein
VRPWKAILLLLAAGVIGIAAFWTLGHLRVLAGASAPQQMIEEER